jgi:phospho-N-acetylmuramoyl-pentapeptide-transferase
VGYFKATKDAAGNGKRLFRMAPFHHHLELGGMSEVRVVRLLYAVAVMLAIVGGTLASWQ